MAALSFADLIEQASAEGFSSELLPGGDYQAEIAGTSCGKSQGGKEQIGIRFKVIHGPHAGKSFWMNLTLSPENPKALAVFFRQLSQLGLSADFVRAQTSVAGLAAGLAVGAAFDLVVAVREFNGKQYQDVKGIKAAGAAPSSSPAPTPVAAPIESSAPKLPF